MQNQLHNPTEVVRASSPLSSAAGEDARTPATILQLFMLICLLAGKRGMRGLRIFLPPTLPSRF